jgi:hypothetical protein
VRVLAAAVLLVAALAGCGGPAEPVWALDDEVGARRATFDGPPSLTLYTVRNARNGSGGHTGLMINAPSQRVLFDPAGTFHHPYAPERNDVVYGVSEDVRKVYVDYHARETFDVVVQEKAVPPEVAEQAIRAVEAYGAVPKAQCSLAVTGVLRQLPGFEGIPRTYFPIKASKAFGRLPGATTQVVTDDDADDNHGVLFVAAQKAAVEPPPPH